MKKSHSLVPNGFIRFSDAARQLEQGLWGGLQRPLPVQEIKRTYKKSSIGFGPWRELAGRILTNAANGGKLRVYVSVPPEDDVASGNESQHIVINKTEPVMVPVEVVMQLIASRGSLPDHPIRPSIKSVDGDMKLLGLLKVGVLVVRESEFKSWYRFERARGKWPSQRSKLHANKGGGRPSKKTQSLQNIILGFIRDATWTAKDGTTKLHRLLVMGGHIAVPSRDTLRRLINDMHAATGKQELLLKSASGETRRRSASRLLKYYPSSGRKSPASPP